MSNNDPRQVILVVDDEPTNIQALGNLLKDDYRIRVANSGEKTLALLQGAGRSLPDLILLDVQMPGIDGYEICRRLKDDLNTSSIPIIFVTARSATSDEEYGLNLGAVDYITKPFSPAIVRARVSTQMRLKRKTDLLEQYAMLDGLTGIPNRRQFDERLDKEWRRSLRDGLPLSVIMLDIDHFKGFNDHYGHGAGDQCLQKVARTLSDTLVRAGDCLCRYGGEEFIALLPNTEATGTHEVAEHLRVAVESLAIPHNYSSVASVVTISLGTATFDPATFDTARGSEIGPPSLIDRADAALYAAKKAGRNRVS